MHFKRLFFPVLLIAFCLLWYRREVLWRIKTHNAGWARNPFRLNKQFDFPDYVLFWFFGWIWVIFWETAIGLSDDAYLIISDFLYHDLFNHTLIHLYPAHANSEEAITDSFIIYSREFRKEELIRSDKDLRYLTAVAIYRQELFFLTSYVLLFGRYFLMQPFYLHHQTTGAIQFNWQKMMPIVFILLALYGLFFLNPVHRDVCPSSRARILCTDLGKAKYFAFPARMLFYWTIILGFLRLAMRHSLIQKDEHKP